MWFAMFSDAAQARYRACYPDCCKGHGGGHSALLLSPTHTTGSAQVCCPGRVQGLLSCVLPLVRDRACFLTLLTSILDLSQVAMGKGGVFIISSSSLFSFPTSSSVLSHSQ